MGVLAAMQADEKLPRRPRDRLDRGQHWRHEEMALLAARRCRPSCKRGCSPPRKRWRTSSRHWRGIGGWAARRSAWCAAPWPTSTSITPSRSAREDVASHVGVSARHLTRCFQQEVGLSPIAYLNRYRVRQAKRLLEAGDSSITAVADAVGFASSGYFTDAFRREVGMSPREYQRRNLAPNS